MPSLIEIDAISKSFDGGRTYAVREATLLVEEGTFLALVGTSGSGKTTTLKCLNRLIHPDTGEVRIAGEVVGSGDPAALRRRIGYVFQGIGLFPHMTIGENIGITPQLLGWPPAEIAARVEELLDLVELPRSYSSRYPRTLSGGQQQRAGVARAIAARPRIVLMDEPFGALDPLTRDVVGSAYRALHDRLGLTTIMVTHDMEEAILLSDRIAVMKAGHVLAHDTPRALMSDPPHPDVATLMDLPRRRVERIRALSDRTAAGQSDG
ncbi:MAG TPA: ABC transporter ATP-binding protein [Xanthobacteraceae bacterium]|jgi:osmoprotectant transport system ATP-binding protein